jgi:hypothetical protein
VWASNSAIGKINCTISPPGCIPVIDRMEPSFG